MELRDHEDGPPFHGSAGSELHEKDPRNNRAKTRHESNHFNERHGVRCLLVWCYCPSYIIGSLLVGKMIVFWSVAVAHAS